MYKSILIPTDGSELAEKALRDGISLSKAIGAEITVLTVTIPFHIFTTDPKSIEHTRPQYNERMKRHAARFSRQLPMPQKCRALRVTPFTSSMSTPIKPSSILPPRKVAISSKWPLTAGTVYQQCSWEARR